MRLVLLIVTVVSTVGFNFHVLLPLLASDTLNTGPEVFGILSACFGAGALVGALLSAAIGRASWKVLVLGTGGFSVSLLALAPLETVWACGVLLFIAGGCFTLWTSNANSILQLNAPDHLRGRVVSLYLWAFAGLRADRWSLRRLAGRSRRDPTQLHGRRSDRARDDPGHRTAARRHAADGRGGGYGVAASGYMPGSGFAPSSSAVSGR